MTDRVKVIGNDIFFAQVMDILRAGESVTIMVSGHSMAPTFEDKVDKIIISPFDATALKRGDVVLFDRGDTICVHRIISRKGDRLVIRGDGNGLRALERVKVDAVMGIVTGGTMFGGKEFSTDDKAWKDNTGRILRWFALLSLWRFASRVVRRYPLSIITLAALMYCSFFDPSGRNLPSIVGYDKLVHALMYTGLTLVFWFEWMLRHIRSRRDILRGFVFCFVFPILLGASIECAQEYLIEYRSGEWLDILANTVGVCIATVLSFAATLPLLKHIFRRYESSR